MVYFFFSAILYKNQLVQQFQVVFSCTYRYHQYVLYNALCRSNTCRRHPQRPTRTIVRSGRIGAHVHHFLCTKSQSVRIVHGLNPCAMRTVCTSKSERAPTALMFNVPLSNRMKNHWIDLFSLTDVVLRRTKKKPAPHSNARTLHNRVTVHRLVIVPVRYRTIEREASNQSLDRFI